MSDAFRDNWGAVVRRASRASSIVAVAAAVLAAELAFAQTSRDSWEVAIAKVSVSAKAYKRYSSEILGTTWVGAGFVNWKADEHKCAILGRMLGKTDEVSRIETFEYPPMDTRTDPYDLLLFSVSLENWAGAASWALEAQGFLRREQQTTAAGDFGSNIYHLDGLVEKLQKLAPDFDDERAEREAARQMTERPNARANARAAAARQRTAAAKTEG